MNAVEEDRMVRVVEALEFLSERERVVITMRFGLVKDGKKMTLRQTGEKFGVSGARILAIEQKALRKLRHPRYVQYILGERESL